MPMFRVERIVKVRKVYEIEAPNAKTAGETARLNEPDDQFEDPDYEVQTVEQIK